MSLILRPLRFLRQIFPTSRNMLWVCSDCYICKRFTFPATPRHGMNNGVKSLSNESYHR